MIELVRDLKKFIFVNAWLKLSQVMCDGKASGLARTSGFNFKELTNTKKNGNMYAKAKIRPTINVTFFPTLRLTLSVGPHISWRY
jgi:hypothetical protein